MDEYEIERILREEAKKWITDHSKPVKKIAPFFYEITIVNRATNQEYLADFGTGPTELADLTDYYYGIFHKDAYRVKILPLDSVGEGR